MILSNLNSRNVVISVIVVVVILTLYLMTKLPLEILPKSSNSSKMNVLQTKSRLPTRYPVIRSMAIIGTDVAVSKLKDFKVNSKYILVIPRALTKVHSLWNTNLIDGAHKQKVIHLTRTLDKRGNYDGATCMGTASGPPIQRSCYFETKNWTLLIGKSKTPAAKEDDVIECNIIEHAFVIRRKVFETLYFNPQYGETTLLDFFLRSKGKLKIAGISSCSFSDELNRRDRGGLEKSSFFTDYMQFDKHHGIVRIVRENEITWTKCSYQTKLCPEKPLNSLNIKSSRELLPVCCSEVLNKVLVDVVQALQTMGLEYRIEYGTLLGAVRSGTIIPWTRDVDIGLKENDYNSKNTFQRLEQLLRPKKYALAMYLGQRRTIPLFPPTRSFKGSPFDPAFQKRLFKSRTMNIVRDLANIATGSWKNLGYLDFYFVNDKQFESFTTIQINGRNYSTVIDVKEKLEKWYGPNYMNPDKIISASEGNLQHSSNLGYLLLWIILLIFFIILMFQISKKMRFKCK